MGRANAEGRKVLQNQVPRDLAETPDESLESPGISENDLSMGVSGFP